MLIFLDIDGVMVHGSSWKPVETLADGFYKFDVRAAAGLQAIISKTKANIMLTTSHKNKFTPKEWKVIFKNRGIDVEVVTKLRTRKWYPNRKAEIIAWCKRHQEVQKFVIIDDDKSLNGLPTALKEKFILTNPSVGLTQYDAEQAIKILKKRNVKKKDQPASDA